MIRLLAVTFALVMLSGCGSSSTDNNDAPSGQLTIDAVDLSE